MKTLSSKSYLFVSGLVMTLVGSYIALSPVHYLNAMRLGQIEVPIGLLSDLRGLGGTLLVMGMGVMASVFISPWQRSALIITTVFYANYALLRSLSLLLDGMPDTAISIAYFIELMLALIGCWLCWQGRQNKSSKQPPR